MRRDRWSSIILSLLSFAVVGLVLRNVFGNNDDVVAMAKTLGCEGITIEPCQMTAIQRNPIAQEITISSSKTSRQIQCARALYLVGDYHCEKRP